MHELITCFLLLLLAGTSMLPSKRFDPGEELVAYYSFDQCDARDVTGGLSHGVVHGDAGCHCGVSGNALFIDGVDDYIEFAGRVNQYFNTMDVTVSFYIKPGKYSIFPQSLLSKRQDCELHHLLDLQLDVNRRTVLTDLYESPYIYYKDISPQVPDTDWIHYAVVRQGTRAFTYINGELRREGRRCSGVDLGNDALLSFANSPCLQSGRMVRFKGGIDELRIFNRALSHAEISALYAMHPVELAEIDCISAVPQAGPSKYLCERQELSDQLDRSIQ